MAGERISQVEEDKREVSAFRTLQNLNDLSGKLGYGFSTAKFGNMSHTHGPGLGQTGEKVSENRKRFASAAGFNAEKMVEMKPEAGNMVLVVGKKDIGVILSPADALITTEKEVPLVLLPADCTPIIITNRKGEFAAIVHAGREGTKAEIAKEVVKKLAELGFTNPTDFLVGIGPAVECYNSPTFATDDPERWLHHVYVPEVEGEEIEFRVVPNDTKFPGKFKIETHPHRDLFVDITGCNVAQLGEMGIPKENIVISGICTVCNATLGRMYSHGLSMARKEPPSRVLAYVELK